jgi:hypothetical protein
MIQQTNIDHLLLHLLIVKLWFCRSDFNIRNGPVL